MIDLKQNVTISQVEHVQVVIVITLVRNAGHKCVTKPRKDNQLLMCALDSHLIPLYVQPAPRPPVGNSIPHPPEQCASWGRPRSSVEHRRPPRIAPSCRFSGRT